MGSGQSKPSNRKKMESSFQEDDVDSLDIADFVETKPRLKSNFPSYPSNVERIENGEEDYFNKIYNKKLETSLVSVNGSAKTAPVSKDPEVSAALSEIEETFKVLGDEPLSPVKNIPDQSSVKDIKVPESFNLENDSVANENSVQEPSNSPEVNDRQLISRNNDRLNSRRQSNKLLEIGGYSSESCSSSSSSQRGEQRLLISSYGKSKHFQTQSLLMQQRKEFQKSGRDGGKEKIRKAQRDENDWTYNPPKIDGFDISKFKEVNSKVTQGTIMILRGEEEQFIEPSRKNLPSYTKDELDLIASLEREVY